MHNFLLFFLFCINFVFLTKAERRTKIELLSLKYCSVLPEVNVFQKNIYFDQVGIFLTF